MPDRLSAALADRYRIERELTGGGMSRVFLAREQGLGREVVIKLLSADVAAGVSLDRFAREIQVVASLQQANIVPLLSAGNADGVPYYTMPFVEGESLRGRLSEGEPLSVRECVGILRDVARALSYAHAHGVVHRDIKPDNVLLSHGAAVVTDFGIAKAVTVSRTIADAGTLTQAGLSIGTPAYMAPEQVAGDPRVDHRVDLYAWGCLAYELLAGQPPFVGDSPQRLLAAHLSETPVPVSERCPELPATLAQLVMRCLEKEPDARPASADALLRGLDAVLTPGDLTAGAPPSRTPMWRGPVAVASAVLALLLVVSFLVWRGLGTGARASGAAMDHSVAVLPLANLSGDPSDDYFGIGLSEEMTRALAKAGIRVIGRASAGALQARGLDERAIAKELGVGSLLTGSVQRAGDQLRISVTLSAADGAVRWSQAYDRPLVNVFAVQDEIAREVVRELRGSFGGTAAGSFVQNETTDPEAHALVLQGSVLWNRRTEPAIRQAIALFERAIGRDPNYARAYAWLALANSTIPWYSDSATAPFAERALAAADRALALDPTVAEAHAAAGAALMTLGRNADAEQRYQMALAIDSTFAPTWGFYSLLEMRRGGFDAARRDSERAIALEPASLILRFHLGLGLRVARRFAEADSALSSVIARDSTFGMAWVSLGEALTHLGRSDEAIRDMEQWAVGNPGLRQSDVLGILALILARAGRPADARQVLQRLRAAHGGRLPPNGSVATALAELGERDEAVAVLGRAVAEHDSWIFLSRSEPYDKLRADARGAALLAPLESW